MTGDAPQLACPCQPLLCPCPTSLDCSRFVGASRSLQPQRGFEIGGSKSDDQGNPSRRRPCPRHGPDDQVLQGRVRVRSRRRSRSSWEDSEFIDRIVDVPNSAARGAMLRAGTCYMEMFQYSAPAPNVTKRPAAVRQGLHAFLRRCHGHRKGVRALEGSRHDVQSARAHRCRPREVDLWPGPRRQPDRDCSRPPPTAISAWTNCRRSPGSEARLAVRRALRS